MLDLGSKVDIDGSQIEVNLFDGCLAGVYDLFGFGLSSYVVFTTRSSRFVASFDARSRPILHPEIMIRAKDNCRVNLTCTPADMCRLRFNMVVEVNQKHNSKIKPPPFL
jgi:hypothetical protein